MTDRLTIRRYRDGDKNAVWHVHERAFEAALEAFHPQLDRDLRRIPSAYLEAGEFLVGTVGGQLVAVGGFRPVGSAAVEIKRMRVDPAVQGRGHGRALLEALENRARDRGYELAVLHTSEQLPEACAFYRSQGYDEVEREFHPGIEAELVHFQKVL